MANSTSILDGSVALPKVSYSTDGGSTYVAVAKLLTPAFPEVTTEQYETTNTDITDGFKTYISGWSDGGELSLELLATEDEYVKLRSLERTSADWKITWTDPEHDLTDPQVTFNAFITGGPSIAAPINDVWKITISVKMNGDYTLTPGTTTP